MKTCILAGALLASAVAATITPTVNNVQGTVRNALGEVNRLKRARQVQKACTDAVAALGAAKVDTKPLNSTTVTKNWSDTCISEPYCIIQPTSAEDVSKTLGIISSNQIKFAVRSGGHSPNPGWSSIGDSGILVDMSGLSAVSLSADGKVASVGPGAYWGDVSAVLGPQGATVVGARAPYVGVGGLLLGGGYSYFVSEYGLAVDNVKNYEIVLANGTITNANASQNPDLFWALKGGGPNFGIVTKIDINTIPVQTLWYQALVFLPTQAHEVLDALVAWQESGASDEKTGMLFSAGLDSILVLLTYSDAVTSPAAFSSILGLDAAQVAIPATNSTLAGLFQLVSAAFPALPGRHDYRGVSSRINAQLYKDVYDFWLQKATAVHETTGANQTFVIQHVSANVAQVGSANGGNPLNLPQEDHQWWTTLADWTDEADDDLVRSVSIETTQQWKTVSRSRDLDLDFIYMNDASRDQNPIAGYGATNIAQLKATALKYDPSQVFQTLQNNGFLLSKV